jgi:Flp pilus assembly protein TadG
VQAERGAVAVEFAILAPLLVLILFAVIQFGIGLNRIQIYVSAAREGARYAAVHCRPDALQCTTPMIDGRVSSAASGYPVATPVAVNRDCSVLTNFGQPVTVSWTQPILIDVPFWDSVTIDVPVSGSFRCE